MVIGKAPKAKLKIHYIRCRFESNMRGNSAIPPVGVKQVFELALGDIFRSPIVAVVADDDPQTIWSAQNRLSRFHIACDVDAVSVHALQ